MCHGRSVVLRVPQRTTNLPSQEAPQGPARLRGEGSSHSHVHASQTWRISHCAGRDRAMGAYQWLEANGRRRPEKVCRRRRQRKQVPHGSRSTRTASGAQLVRRDRRLRRASPSGPDYRRCPSIVGRCCPTTWSTATAASHTMGVVHPLFEMLIWWCSAARRSGHGGSPRTDSGRRRL